jgi:hypothetical protein
MDIPKVWQGNAKGIQPEAAWQVLVPSGGKHVARGVWRRRGSLVAHYEGLVAHYGSLVVLYGSLVEFYGSLVEFYESLVDVYGKRVDVYRRAS